MLMLLEVVLGTLFVFVPLNILLIVFGSMDQIHPVDMLMMEWRYAKWIVLGCFSREIREKGWK